ncbi:hypothetical protein D9Q98_003431 [Chlorella vulgaris]|uniref:Uncharacterized protein n=1 Tax=Chlorella vulgaris TaxID=3077 RepID=A0A9D4YYH3_CHLVU|nr:hypothetical protein D9Q98_003431 [Chlorella vulgaris]
MASIVADTVDALHARLQSLLSQPAGTAITALALALLALSLLRFVAGVLGFIYAYFLRPGRNLKSYGAWAVVTGATDGIGKAYCVELAKKGLNIVLISRTQSKLEAVAAELEEVYGVHTRVVAADLSKAGPEMFTKIGAALEGLEVGLLVNNAGLSYDHPEYLDQVAEQDVYDVVAVNALVPTMLARMVLGGMRERGRGAIVNIGSGAATVIPSSPLLAVYAGTKAYVDCFSRSLDGEYAPLGVRVQNQAPMFVATKMSKIRRPRLDAPGPDTWAAAAVRQIGRETSLTPYWFHGLQHVMVRSAPVWLINRQVMGIHQGLRARYYSKLARTAAAAVNASGAAGEGDEAPATDIKRELRRRK